jgi:flagellar basal-body rod modification protein FlgD
VTVGIFDAAGSLVRGIDLGAQPGGRFAFGWDGLDAKGERVPAGRYVVRGEAELGGAPVALETLVEASVESVTLRRSPPGATLNLAGLGPVDIGAVRELR